MFILRNRKIEKTVPSLGSRDGAVVRVLASHQCGPGLLPGLGIICRLSLLLVPVLALRGFFRALRFAPLLKNQHFQIPIRSGYSGCATANYFTYLFIYLFNILFI